MNGNRGKMAAQAGHAYLHAFWDSGDSFYAGAYKDSERAYKICLVVDTTEELKELYVRYQDICGVSLVRDAGITVFEEPTITCLGIGPITEDYIGDDLKALKVLI